MKTFWLDLCYGWRMLRKNPGFAAVAILTLALGIGASTAVFSWVDAVLLHPLPGVADPGRLVSFETVAPNGDAVTTSYPDYRDYRDHLKLLAGLTVTQPAPLTIGEEDNARQVWGELVAGNYFTVLGVRPALGRTFLPQEFGDAPGAYPVVVISYRLWRTYFNSNPSLIGQTIRVNQRELTVVGVAAPDFRGSEAGLAYDLWVPLMMKTQLEGIGAWMLQDRRTRQYFGLARLKPGVTIAQAQAEVAALAHQMAIADADANEGISATLLPLWKSHFGAQELLLAPLEILMALCAVLLLIVCANVANLLLARFAARQREFSVRLALGAARARLARQVLTESLALAAAGAFAGVWLAVWLSSSLQYLLPPSNLPVAFGFQVNGYVLAFAVLIGVGTAFCSSLAPALQSAKADLNEGLKEGGRGGMSGPQSRRTRSLLVVSEVSLALVALVGAGLFVRSFQAARTINPGFDSNHVLLSRFYLPSSGYNLEQRKQFCLRLRQRLESDPGITAVCYSDCVPLGFEGSWWEDLRIEGYVPNPGENMKIFRNVVSPGFFHLMRISVLEGRDFTEQDDEKSAPVMIVNQTFVRRFMGGGDPIGRRVQGWGEWLRVVGVVKDTKYQHLTEASLPYFYVPFRQLYRADMNLAFYVRAAGSFDDAAAAVREEVRDLDPNVTGFDSIPLADYMGANLYAQKVAASMLSALGALALLLAAVGLYSVMSYSVSQRIHEIGIRIALGARQANVLQLVLAQGARLALMGVGIGVVATVPLTRLVASFLYGVDAADPRTYLGVALLLTLVALLACYVPARRAAKLDPVQALRRE
ncbi:MAG TPA: ABC transporter permease [Terriglobia bacterium]